MNLMPLINLIEGEGLGSQGEDLFLQMLPAEAEQAILLRPPLSGTKIDHELKNFYRGEFQMIVRSHGYVAGEELAKKVVQAITLDNQQVEGQFFHYCRPMTLPVAFPLSKGNLVEHNVRFEACYVEAP